MIVSKKYNFAFIEVPKTASSSIRSVLERFDDYDHGLSKHASARAIRQKMGPRDWKALTSFGVIRSPHDWMRSWYKFWRGGSISGRFDEGDPNFLEDISFDEFVRRVVDRGDDDKFKNIRSQYRKLGGKNPKNIFVSRLLCYDFLAREFSDLVNELNLPDIAELPSLNVSAYQPAELDMADDTRALIEQHWPEDIALYEKCRVEAAKRYGMAA